MAFTAKTFEYLRDLEANNERGWFEANRERYETHWKAAALDFIARVSDRMAGLDPPLRAEAKLNGSLRRINRDVRFSKDKSPYSARLHMIFWAGGTAKDGQGMHVVLSPDGVGYGGGHYGIEPGRLAELRARIAGPDGDGLIAALEAAAGVGCRMGEPDLKRLPKGFEAEGRREELLRYKGFVARTHGTEAKPEVIMGAGAEDWVMGVTEGILPLIRWLRG
ncbi:MAG: TIGR02453 family protein [Silicimonas sp.]|jgi:uncharacterized protein (TIGR02453 family)|nr:TIGR02453 family protein [Silicimonas sp.]